MHQYVQQRLLPLLGALLISGALAATVAHAATLQPQAYLPLIVKAANTPTPTATSVPTATPGGLLSAQEQQTLDLINGLRRDAGCSDLKAVGTLQNAAAAHNIDMITNNFFDHDSSDGSSFSVRITKYGYKWSLLGENIAAGYTTPASVVNAWKNSPGHYANIVNCKFQDTGLSAKADSEGTLYWTQDFGRPQ
ncbi:CAP domain-containing protein [Chloroflexia bacterium SDU3-3]|nr:CAP domain-containing protein [Chloroflexia bacterium SDU3-3]